jgi:hypothetical protein
MNERLMKRNKIRIDKENSIKTLKEYLKEGMTIHAIIRSVSNSGMTRNISFKITDKDNMLDLSFHIAKALKYPFNDKKHAVKVSGCGMDMAFHVIHNLSHVLYGKGYQLKSNII